MSACAMAQQPHPILTSFIASEQPNGILLKWVIAGGNQCQGTKMFRSLDQMVFEQIGHIPGICGGTQADETYTYFDTVPYGNHYNHYRLEMVFQGFTDIVTVFFEDFGSSDHALLSDHALGTYRILYTNDLNSTNVLEVFDRFGHSVYRASGNDSDFDLRTDGWPPGVYVFRISGSAGTDIRGKIYIGP